MKKEELTQILDKIGLSKKEFASKCDISYNTVNNWNDDNKPVPPWVSSWLDNFIKAKRMDAVVDAVRPYVISELQ